MEDMLKVTVTLEFDESFVKRLDKFFTEECIDREKWYEKKAFHGIEKSLASWERQQGRIRRLSGSQSQKGGIT